MSGLNYAIGKGVRLFKLDGIERFAYATATTLVTTHRRPGTEVPRYFAVNADGVYEVTTEYGNPGLGVQRAARSAKLIASLDGVRPDGTKIGGAK